MSKDRITDLSEEDETWLRRAEEHILKIVRGKYGVNKFNRSRDDLLPLQRLIDDHEVTAKDVLETQCIGVVLGNVFAENTSMQWKRVENEYGDMISLHDEGIHFTLCPLTMISKRLEDRREIALIALYEDFIQSLHLKNNEG